MNVLSLPLLQANDLTHAHLPLFKQDASTCSLRTPVVLATNVNAFNGGLDDLPPPVSSTGYIF